MCAPSQNCGLSYAIPWGSAADQSCWPEIGNLIRCPSRTQPSALTCCRPFANRPACAFSALASVSNHSAISA